MMSQAEALDKIRTAVIALNEIGEYYTPHTVDISYGLLLGETTVNAATLMRMIEASQSNHA